MENSVYIDAQGVIISKDPEEVAKLRAESKEKVANLSIDERKRQMRLDFHDQLTMMAQYEKDSEGFKSAKQNAAKIYKESGTAFMALDNTQDYLLDNTLGFNISSQDNGHTFVKAFEKEITESYGQYYVSPINNPKYAAQFYPQYAEVILETELENIRDVYHSERYPKVEKAMASINGLYNNLLNRIDDSKKDIKMVIKDDDISNSYQDYMEKSAQVK